MINIKDEVVIVAAKRSAIGLYKKNFSNLRVDELFKIVLDKVIDNINIDKNKIDMLIVGSVLQAGRGQNIARQIALKSGLRISTTAYTVNMVCGSGMKAVILAAQEIITGQAEIVVAGGVEIMSNSEYMIEDGLTDAFSGVHMGITAENVVDKYGLERVELDNFTVKSHKKAVKAKDKRSLEIVEVEDLKDDLFVREDQSIEKLSKLNPVFKENGKVTAGNTTGLNDGCSVLILMKKSKAKELGLNILASIKDFASIGCSPDYMGLAPIYAINKLLDKNKLSVNDIDLFEINEAFASQSLVVQKELNIPDNKLNIYGGGLALGHPIGSTGARLIVSLVNELEQENLSTGIASLCIGGGQGISVLIERENENRNR